MAGCVHPHHWTATATTWLQKTGAVLMAILHFVLSPQQCARLHDALNCLSKFSETICIEARFGQLLLSALNSSLSAYCLFTLSKDNFFDSYVFDSEANLRDERFACSILNRSLASVFKGRLGDAKIGDGGIDRCEADFEEGASGEESRLVMRLVYQQGVTKTFRLNYESAEMMKAVFDKSTARSRWRAQARMLREVSEFFGPKTEQLDMYVESEQVTLTSYTEKIMHGKETLKQPLHTAITLDTSDFDHFDVQDDLHIAISIKDFRSIISHADSLKVIVDAQYSNPGHPLQLTYSGEGMRCEFTLMTIGGQRSSTSTVSRAATREVSSRPTRGPSTNGSAVPGRDSASASVNEPSNRDRPTASGRLGRRTPGQASLQADSARDADPESLFIPAPNDDDERWQPIDETEPQADTVGWDTSAEHDASRNAVFRDGSFMRSADETLFPQEGILPTQRASEFRGLFD